MYKYASSHMVQVDSRWTPGDYLESGGVHLNYVEQCKVLHLSLMIMDSFPLFSSILNADQTCVDLPMIPWTAWIVDLML